MPELFVVNGICGGTVFFLPDVPTVVGRSTECHVQIADPWISSMHALFERRGDQLWVVDLDSRNGTFVDEERMHEAPLSPGVRLRFGKTEAELRAGPAPAPLPGLSAGGNTIIRYLADLVGGTEGPPSTRSGEPGEIAGQEGRQPSGMTDSRRRLVQVLNEIARISISGAELDEMLRRTVSALSAATGAERAGVLLLDERGNVVTRTVEPPGADPLFSTAVVSAALRARAGILTFDAQQDPRFAYSSSVISQGIRSCLCAPIWTDNRILGALVLDRTFAQPFDADDLELATLVGLQAASAVERSRLAERSRTATEQRQRLLRFLPAAVTALLLGGEPAEPPLEPALYPDAATLVVKLSDPSMLAAERPPAEVAQRVLDVQSAAREILLGAGAAVEAGLTGELAAVFGVTPPVADGTRRALRCALAVRSAVQRVEATRPQPRLVARIGVAAGTVLAGNFGTANLPELRAVGGPVELAGRLADDAEFCVARVEPGAAERAGAEFEFTVPGEDGVRELLRARDG